MPRVPKDQRKYISPYLESQLPDFVKTDHPNFVAFLKAYYEWLETYGTKVYTGKVISSTPTTIVLDVDASNEDNYYKDFHITVENGPAIGQTRLVTNYVGATHTVTVEETWNFENVPPINSRISLVEPISTDHLLTYGDIDDTLQNFITYFKNTYLQNIPSDILTDQATVLKNIKSFYRSRGTEKSFRFLFRLLFNEEIEFYFPKVDLFRTSNAAWYVEPIMRVTAGFKHIKSADVIEVHFAEIVPASIQSAAVPPRHFLPADVSGVLQSSSKEDTFGWKGREVEGVQSGAKAYVEKVSHFSIGPYTVAELSLTNIRGEFVTTEDGYGELIKVVYPYNAVNPEVTLDQDRTVHESEYLYRILSEVNVLVPGDEYSVGDLIDIIGWGYPAKAIVTAVYTRYYTGRVGPPPDDSHLKPFWGANLPPNERIKGEVAIPGMFFFNDYQRIVSPDQIINSNEIQLSSTESGVDDFFSGCDITLTDGTGKNQTRHIISYNGITKVAVIDVAWDIIPDVTTTYSIYKIRGGIKAVKVIDFGLAFTYTPNCVVNSTHGQGAVLQPKLGGVGEYPGRWLNDDGFLSAGKVLQDSFYWQDFSYDIRSGNAVDRYKEPVLKLLHPAGTKLFGSYLIKTRISKQHLMKSVQNIILTFEAKNFVTDRMLNGQAINTLGERVKINTEETQVLKIEGNDGRSSILSQTNAGMDSLKFKVFPPSSTFTYRFPYPNTDYWSPTGPANTQIAHVQNWIIGDIINNPTKKCNLQPDVNLRVQSKLSTTHVGPVGVSARTLERIKANQDFAPFSQVGEITLEEVIIEPETKHSDIDFDTEIIFRYPVGIPPTGKIVEYKYQIGGNDQIVYNVANSNALYYGSRGSTVLTDADDPTWEYGLRFHGSQIVNATSIPNFTKELTVIILAQTTSVTGFQTLASNIHGIGEEGFSIEVTPNGGVSFRCVYNGETKIVSFPAGSVSGWFLATLTFENGVLGGRINKSNISEKQFVNYPDAPTMTNTGWMIGSPSPDYVVDVISSVGTFGRSLFMGSTFLPVGGSTTVSNTTFFDGYVGYTLIYDRKLYEFEVFGIYDAMQDFIPTIPGIPIFEYRSDTLAVTIAGGLNEHVQVQSVDTLNVTAGSTLHDVNTAQSTDTLAVTITSTSQCITIIHSTDTLNLTVTSIKSIAGFLIVIDTLNVGSGNVSSGKFEKDNLDILNTSLTDAVNIINRCTATDDVDTQLTNTNIILKTEVLTSTETLDIEINSFKVTTSVTLNASDTTNISVADMLDPYEQNTGISISDISVVITEQSHLVNIATSSDLLAVTIGENKIDKEFVSGTDTLAVQLTSVTSGFVDSIIDDVLNVTVGEQKNLVNSFGSTDDVNITMVESDNSYSSVNDSDVLNIEITETSGVI